MTPASAPWLDYRQIALAHFGIDGAVTALPGYEDSNALVESSNGARYVLRVSPPAPDLARLRFVDEVMNGVQIASFNSPSSLPTRSQAVFAPLPGNRIARLFTWVEGTTADDAGRPPAAAVSLGRTAAEMVNVLAPMTTQFRRDDATWDPGRSLRMIEAFRHHVAGGARSAVVDHVLTHVAGVPFEALPTQIIHSDLNAGNVVLSGDVVTGVIDFEDVVHTIRIGELSVACAYAMLVQENPVSVAMDVIRGYRQLASVTELEATHLFALTLSRMAVSVCVAASRPPGNPHQHHISSIMWDLLTRLTDEDLDVLSTRFKDAALS